MKKALSLMLAVLIIFAGIPLMSVGASSTFEIVSAEYGSATEKLTVTNVVAGMMVNGILPEFTVGNDTMSCVPQKADGETNRLVVCYKDNGVKKYLCVAEGSIASLPFRYDPEQIEETKDVLAQELATSDLEKVWPESGLRGFNFGGTIGNFNANPGFEGQYVTEETFKRLKSWGVNCLRIPIAADYGYAWSTDTIPADDPVAPYRHHLEGLRVALKLAEKYDMWIIPSGDNVVGRKIDIMYNEADGSGYNATLNDLWSYIATNFGSHPRLLGYDLLNEPNTQNDSQYYMNTVLPMLVNTIRAVDTNSYVIVEPATFALPEHFGNLSPIADAKAVYSFHYYYPHQYTHQGIGDYSTSYTYPGVIANFPTSSAVMWDKARIEQSVEVVKNFQTANNAIILVGEFGVVRQAGGSDQWIQDAIDVWEANGWSWCYHSYGGYNGFNPTFNADATPSNVMDGGVESASLAVLKTAFNINVDSMPPIVKQTTTNNNTVKKFVADNKVNNLLAGLNPDVSQEGTTNKVFATGGTLGGLTDGTYSSGTDRYTVNPTSPTGILRFTYSLPYKISISDLFVVCRENNGTFAFNYEVYASNSIDTLYNAENLAFAKGDYTEGGQLVSYGVGSQIDATFIGFRFTEAANKYHIGELGVYGEILEVLPVVKQTVTNSAEVQAFVTNNVDNNLLDQSTLTIAEEGTNYSDFWTSGSEDVLTDGSYNKYVIFPSGIGDQIFRFTYTLPHRSNISDLLVVCRENSPGTYAFDYEIYVSDDVENLYNSENLVFSKGNYAEGGQLVSLTEDIQPVGSFVGFRLTNAVNKYHLGELGVYGTRAPSLPVIKQTTTNSAEVQTFATNNVNNNLLKGLKPTLCEEETTVEVSGADSGWETLTDANYSTRKSSFTTGRGNGVFRYTYTLPYRANVSDLLVVCRENNPVTYAFDYEIYVSDSHENLYDAKNLVFTKGDYTAGGQLVSLAEDIQPVGSFVGFRLTDAVNKYHVGEFGVYGSRAPSLPVVKQTTTDSAEVQSFVTNNINNNLLAQSDLTIAEEGTSFSDFLISGGPEVLVNGSYDQYIIFPSNVGDGIFRFTYTLPYLTNISDLLVVCRENSPGTYAFDYEIYVSDSLETLYEAEKLVFAKGENTEGGQLISLAEDIKPFGSFVGFRIINAVNKYHLGELGVYGTRVVTEEDKALALTASDSTEFDASTVNYNKDYLWKFSESEYSGYYTVEHQLSGLYLTMKDGSVCLTVRDEADFYQLWKTVDRSELYGVQGVFDLVCYGEDSFAMTALSDTIGFSETTELGAADGRCWILNDGVSASDGLVCTIKTYQSDSTSNYLNVNNTVWGDLNDDGKRDIRDLIVIKKMSAAIQQTTEKSDLNVDGIKGNSNDLIALRKVLLGISLNNR